MTYISSFWGWEPCLNCLNSMNWKKTLHVFKIRHCLTYIFCVHMEDGWLFLVSGNGVLYKHGQVIQHVRLKWSFSTFLDFLPDTGSWCKMHAVVLSSIAAERKKHVWLMLTELQSYFHTCSIKFLHIWWEMEFVTKIGTKIWGI